MAKVAVALRLKPETLARVDAYAKARGSSRQVFLEASVDAFLDDVDRGVPDLPEVEVAKPAAKVKRPPAVPDGVGLDGSRETVAMARQRVLNAQSQRARARS